MSIFSGVVQEEKQRLESLMQFYVQKVENLPKGSMSFKKKSNHIYGYRVFRENKHVRFVYIGKQGTDSVHEVEKQIAERIKFEQQLKVIKKELQNIEKSLRNF